MDHPPPEQPVSQPSTDLDPRLVQLKAVLDQQIDHCWQPQQEAEHLQRLSEAMAHMVPAVVELGDEASKNLQPQGAFEPWLVTYHCMGQAKSFLLLWRDVLFQSQKAWLKVSVGEATTAQFQQLRLDSQQAVRKAAATLYDNLENPTTHSLNTTSQRENWQLQDNPWPTYKEQLEQLPEQCHLLLQQSRLLWNSSGDFVLISSYFVETHDKWLQQIEQLKTGLTELLADLSEKGMEESEWITTRLNQLQEEWLQLDNPEDFQHQLDDLVSRLPEREKIVVGTDGGLLLFKETDLKKDTRLWLESELVSEIYDLFAIKDNLANKINLSTGHIRNRLSAEKEPSGKSTIKLTHRESIEQILQNFMKTLDKSAEKTQQLKQLTQKKLHQHFQLTKIYEEGFLPRSLQYTITQYRDSTRWNDILGWFKKQGAKLNQARRNVIAEEALSISERIVRVVKNHTPPPENSHYTNMFLNHGWIGDSFVVGRQQEMNRMAELVDNWKSGFRGAVLLTGTRHCGKTLFGEIVDHRFFNSKAIRLVPNHEIEVAGHVLHVKNDLEPVLPFIRNFGVAQQTMIGIDDLEIWHDKDTSLAKNVKLLLNFIDRYATRFFIVVSMSNWMKVHLSRSFEIDKVFQSEINLDTMTYDEIQRAILVRHSATHTELINEDREEASVTEISRVANRICQLSEGNIGEALQRWAFTMEKYDDERILLKQPSLYRLPDFLSTDAALLLGAIMMNKRTTEARLRSLFGPAFSQKYESVLRRMRNLGIIQQRRGQLKVNPFLVNNVGRLLSQKSGFQFYFNNASKAQIRL